MRSLLDENLDRKLKRFFGECSVNIAPVYSGWTSIHGEEIWLRGAEL